jgi:PRC-barrel domain
VANA